MKKPQNFSWGFCITGVSGKIRTRDQRIIRSRGSSKIHINQEFVRPNNECAIDCAIANYLGYGVCCNFLSTSMEKRFANSSSGVND